MAYAKTTWVNGGAPPISAANLNHLETQYDEANTIKRKTSNETVNNSTALQNDDHLLFAVAANEVWEIEVLAIVLTTVAAGSKFAFTVPVAGALSIIWQDAHGHNLANSCLISLEDGTAAHAFVGVAANEWLWIKGLYVGGANAGNLQLQWAQSAAVAVDTKVLTNSYLIAHKLA